MPQSDVRTLGVEEELMLVDPDTGLLTAVSGGAVEANESTTEVEQELFLQQIETSTEPCTDAEALLAGIVAGRRAVGQAAAAAGARAVAMAAPVLAQDERHFTPKERYQRIESEYAQMARQGLVCAMHTHVSVDSDEEAVHVVDGIRPWLPLLLAVSANSPYWNGQDTGHASWRSQVWNRWPTAGPSQPFGDPATYREVTDRMLAWGGGLDAGMLYFDIRLSEKYPTVEVRVADVCTEVEDALLVALLARALVTTVAAEPSPQVWREDLLRVAGWRAGRHGVAGDLVHPVEGRLAPVREVIAVTLAHCRDALEASGDAERVHDLFERLLARGGGATRQRRECERRGDLRAVVEDLARRTEESWA